VLHFNESLDEGVVFSMPSILTSDYNCNVNHKKKNVTKKN